MGVSTRITVLLSLGTALAAAETAEPPRPKSEASATVTVTAEAAPVDVDKTPNPVKVMDLQAIQDSGARTLDALLPDLLPGQIQPYGGPGTLSSLYLGGARDQDVVVLLDGIRITDPASPSPSFSDFSLEGIDRVEILQGPASTRYGADTHGGVVSLSSAGTAKVGFSGEASLVAGNRDLRRAQASPAFGWGSGWAKVGVSAAQEEQSIPADNPFRTVSTALNLGQQVGEDGVVTLTYRNHYRATPLPFAGSYAPPTYAYTPQFVAAQGNSERDQDTIASYRQNLGSAWLLETSFGHVVQRRVEPGMNLGDPSDHFDGQRNQAVASITWTPIKGMQINLLLDNTGDSAAIKGDSARGSHSSAALEAGYEWESGLRAVASGRYQDDDLEYSSRSGLGISQPDSSQFVYKGGLNWLLKSGLRFYVSYGTSYNAPQLSQLTWNLSSGYGSLDSETSRGTQVGASFERGPWSARLELSRTHYDHVIAWKDLGNWNGMYINGTDLRVQGAEASLAYSATDWRLEGFARSQEARNDSQPQAEQLRTSGTLGRPFFSGGLRGSARFGEWRVQARWAYVGSSYQYFDDLGGVEGERTHFNDVSLALLWTPLKRWTFTLRGEHLMQRAWTREEWQAGALLRKNDAYLVPIFPAPGPTASLEATFRY